MQVRDRQGTGTFTQNPPCQHCKAAPVMYFMHAWPIAGARVQSNGRVAAPLHVHGGGMARGMHGAYKWWCRMLDTAAVLDDEEGSAEDDH